MTKIFLALTAVALALSQSAAAPHDVTRRNGLVETRWSNGALRSSVMYRDGEYDGPFRTWYPSGKPYELRHFARGHERGSQQAWTEKGDLYVNYEARDGRRYGLVNSTPCLTVGEDGAANAGGADTSGLPYYDTADFTARWTPGNHRIGSFALTRQTGAAVADRDLSGRIHVASFVYTQCAAICPVMVSQLSKVERAVADMPNVLLVSYTVTPETDTPVALAAFGRARDIDAEKWWLVTGARDQIYGLARQSYFADDDRVGSGSDASAFLHTEKVLLVDGNGRLRGVYNGTQPHQMEQLIVDISRLRGAAAKGER